MSDTFRRTRVCGAFLIELIVNLFLAGGGRLSLGRAFPVGLVGGAVSCVKEHAVFEK